MTTKDAKVSASAGGWKSFWRLIKTSNPPKWLFIAAILLSLLETAAGLVVPLLTKSLVDQMAASSLEMSLIIFFAAAFILQAISSGFSYYFMTYSGERIVSSLRKRLWQHVLTLPISYFDQHESGETMSRITQDTNIVKSLITQHLVTFITGLISIIGAVIILLIIDWKMTLIMLIAVPISIFIILPLGQKIYNISLSTQDEMANFSGNLGRVLSDIRLVKSYHAEKTEMERGDQGITHLFKFGLKEAKIQSIVSPFMSLIMMLVVVVLIGYGGVQVAAGALTAGALVAIIIYLFQIIVPFTEMAAFFTAYQKALGATERIQEILELEHETTGKAEPLNSSNKNISFENLVFSYKDEQVIRNINLLVPAGKTTAFVGPSGSGKTTLFALIERFYSPSDGAILLGEENISEFDLHKWRSQISYVSQESPLMSGTIRENICYGLNRSIPDEELTNAAKIANASEFIENLPDKYDTEVGERGVKLSGGQRQRIAIARAVIRDPKILLLDEATSNLDSASEQLVQEALQNLMQNRTTLIIAHRLSTVFDADQIVVLEKGCISGIGTHEELFEKHALYQKLAKQQLKASS